MKTSLTKQFTFAISALILMTGASVARGETYRGSMDAIQYKVIAFDNNSSMLTERDRGVLRDLSREASNAGQVGSITIAAWSDRALPKKGSKLPDKDRNLAASRAEVISHFLKTELKLSDISTYNMAESSNWLGRTFGSRDADLKSIFSKKGAKAPVTNAEFEVIKNEGGPSHAVVIFEKQEMK